ncbi:DUF4920 domain-containing protein [Maribacter sp. 2308TA10-17]|uniref:DUF4920 domain-containing protein n=1 Tax=Maribacter sp. 2308TA10-17 TaxID=3386276 RepID=UPI0039BCD6B4
MKRINILLVFFLVIGNIVAQDSQSENEQAGVEPTALPSFGVRIDQNNAISSDEMAEKYAAMKTSDTLQTKFVATVTEVCQSKGCWMKLQLEDGQETMVRFKDYGFFMPKDIKGKEVIVNGLAFVEEMSIKDQKHYAEDAGKSADEIAKITEAKKSLGFEADGVLLKD